MLKEKAIWKPTWTITKYADDDAFARDEHYEKNVFEGNLLLNAGITLLLNLLMGAGGTAYNNANAYIGVGDSSTAASAGQDALQAVTNKLYRGMVTSYPVVSNQTITFRSQFASGDANFAWQEFTIANGSSDSATNLNRLQSGQGTKASGQTWTVELAITIG